MPVTDATRAMISMLRSSDEGYSSRHRKCALLVRGPFLQLHRPVTADGQRVNVTRATHALQDRSTVPRFMARFQLSLPGGELRMPNCQSSPASPLRVTVSLVYRRNDKDIAVPFSGVAGNDVVAVSSTASPTSSPTSAAPTAAPTMAPTAPPWGNTVSSCRGSCL